MSGDWLDLLVICLLSLTGHTTESMLFSQNSGYIILLTSMEMKNHPKGPSRESTDLGVSINSKCKTNCSHLSRNSDALYILELHPWILIPSQGRAFLVVAPKFWNFIPRAICLSLSVAFFHKHVKTFCLVRYYLSYPSPRLTFTRYHPKISKNLPTCCWPPYSLIKLLLWHSVKLISWGG